MIRHFSSSSFRYPVEDDAPIMVATTVYKKKALKKKPRPIIYLDGPLYPDESITDYRERVDDLARRCFETMEKRASVDWNYEFIKYVPKKDA